MNREEKLTKKVYSEMAEREWMRLIRDPFHRLEFDTTLYFLKKYLPKKGLILDAGGGPGRYTVELAKSGYNIVLLDFTPENLTLAKKKIETARVQNRVREIIEGSIVDLSCFKDNTFDAVLCLGGPLSHVHPEKERIKAVSELVRVAKSHAPVFISVMGKLGTMTRVYEWPDEVKDIKNWREFYLRGNDYRWCGGRAFCHFFYIDEFEKLFNSKKVRILNKVGLEGLASPNEPEFNRVFKKDKRFYENWLEMHYKSVTHPSVVDLSQHMMIIAEKKRLK